MYHLELRMGIDQARAYNLTEADLHTRFITPLTSGRTIEYGDKEWIADKTRVSVFEAPQLRPDQIAMGRGWPNVQKNGQDVTERVLAAVQRTGAANSTSAALKDRLLGRLSAGSVTLSEVLTLAGEMSKGERFSQQAAVAEMAVWDLLHQDELVLESGGLPVPETEWQWLLMDHRAWVDADPEVRLTR
jgi:hypothetical protein